MPYLTLFVCLALMQGCSMKSMYLTSSMSPEDLACLQWFEAIEEILDEHDINDPGSLRFEGFPQLRRNRFLASMANLATTQEAYAEWLEQMRLLDASEKKLDIDNLPSFVRKRLVMQKPNGQSFEQALNACGKRLNKLSINNDDQKKYLIENASIPDAYQDWKRALGLYPLARYAAKNGITRLHRKLNADFVIPPEKLPHQGKLLRYDPPNMDLLSPRQVSEILRTAQQNPLKIPTLTPVQWQQLFAHFAPSWEIDTRNDTDKIGVVQLSSRNDPLINSNLPTVYTKHAYTRWRGQVLMQLIYQIWLPMREKTGFFDLYSGALDSVLWRVTLDNTGMPVAFDSIHGCGCYYILFPAQGYRAKPTKDCAEAVLSPKPIQAIPSGHRLVLRLQSRTHYLQQVSLTDTTTNVTTRRYQYQNLDQLRALPLPNGEKHSLFGSDGIIDASERLEKYFFWPFGIASPGAMRQWGTHAIAFIGKRHFDDPFIFEHLLEKE